MTGPTLLSRAQAMGSRGQFCFASESHLTSLFFKGAEKLSPYRIRAETLGGTSIWKVAFLAHFCALIGEWRDLQLNPARLYLNSMYMRHVPRQRSSNIFIDCYTCT